MKRDFREARPDEWQQDNRKPKPDGTGYEDLVTINAAFEEYYQKQVCCLHIQSELHNL